MASTNQRREIFPVNNWLAFFASREFSFSVSLWNQWKEMFVEGIFQNLLLLKRLVWKFVVKTLAKRTLFSNFFFVWFVLLTIVASFAGILIKSTAWWQPKADMKRRVFCRGFKFLAIYICGDLPSGFLGATINGRDYQGWHFLMYSISS